MTRKKKVSKARFARFRVKSPRAFKKRSFRTIDVGRPNGVKIIVGRPKGKTTTAPQSFLIEKKFLRTTKGREELRKIKKRFPHIKKGER